MLAYKITAPGLVATMGEKRNFQLKMGLNETPKANCRQNGFHCAENPLDCLNYYPSLIGNEVYMVSAGGDIDEDASDSKISCTELTIIRQLTVAEFVACALLYVKKYPNRPLHHRINKDKSFAVNGFGIAAGKNPRVWAEKIGDVLGFIKQSGDDVEVKAIVVDGVNFQAGKCYTIDGKECLK